MKILILCTGNSCRSQMAHGFLQNYYPEFEVQSAGTDPAEKVNPLAIQVMKELEVDISDHTPDHINRYIKEDWDYVVTVCGDAKDKCPVFVGNVKNKIHIGFVDPSYAIGGDEYILNEFRRIRDEIRNEFEFFGSKIQSEK